jgi:hypothetical protein
MASGRLFLLDERRRWTTRRLLQVGPSQRVENVGRYEPGRSPQCGELKPGMYNVYTMFGVRNDRNISDLKAEHVGGLSLTVQITATCPIMGRNNDSSGEGVRWPRSR